MCNTGSRIALSIRLRALNLAKFIARNGSELSSKLTKFKKRAKPKKQSKLKIYKIIVSLAHFLQRSEI